METFNYLPVKNNSFLLMSVIKVVLTQRFRSRALVTSKDCRFGHSFSKYIWSSCFGVLYIDYFLGMGQYVFFGADDTVMKEPITDAKVRLVTCFDILYIF